MPYINVKVAKTASRKQEQLITSHLGVIMQEILGKNPKGLMISVESDVHIYLGGEFKEYAAYVDVVTAKAITEDQAKQLYATISAVITEDFKVTADDIYVTFHSSDYFGAKGNIL